MTRFIGHRLLLAIPTLIGTTIVVFLTVKLVPGDPVTSLLGPNSTPAARAALKTRLGLDEAMPLQYWHWLTSALQGDLGESTALQTPALSAVLTAFRNTLVLALPAGLVALLGGVVLGGLGAVRRRHLSGRLSTFVSVLSVAAPQYSVALLLVVVFAVNQPIFPAGGMYDVDGGGLLSHLVLPVVAASLVPLGVTARVFRASLIDVLGTDFVTSLRARGLPERAVIRHAAHSALPSLMTISGLQFAYLFGGIIFVETIFSWPGIGQSLYQAIATRDMSVIQAGTLVIALGFVGMNLLVDAVHALVDPRVRA